MTDKPRKEWDLKEHMDNIYKKVLPKVFKRLTEIENRLQAIEAQGCTLNHKL